MQKANEFDLFGRVQRPNTTINLEMIDTTCLRPFLFPFKLGAVVRRYALLAIAFQVISGLNAEAGDVHNKLLILPIFNMSQIHGEDISVSGPLSGKVFVTDTVMPEAVEYMEALLRRVISRHEGVQIVVPIGVDVMQAGLMPANGPRSGRIALVQNIGRDQNAVFVICGYIYAFRDRIGGEYGIDTPARVSFELNMISVATGRMVWQARFTETQKSLDQDLFQLQKFLKRKGRWVTAKEMALQALEEMTETLTIPSSPKAHYYAPDDRFAYQYPDTHWWHSHELCLSLISKRC